ncbi:hypothetical protein CRE_28682 [Caenorhabditis remanei]|uniref:SPK domain-containing protein n=1 Tax=Caenorhabditis remanei TaxID=31234 RepID=E3MJZ7_CAERE|nr:hypothetical protein CRE_28682 [Caenorhabditis remanei]
MNYKSLKLCIIKGVIPPVRQFNTECDKNIMKFLSMKSEEDTTPVSDIDFAQEFKEVTGSQKSYQTLRERYTLVKRQIYLSNEYDEPSRIRMLYVSGTKLHASILNELRKNAFVEVDDKQRITYYKSHDGSLELGGETDGNDEYRVKTVKQEVVDDNPRCSKRRRISKPCYNQEDDDFDNDTLYQSDDDEDESNKRYEVKNWVNSISTPAIGTVKTETRFSEPPTTTTMTPRRMRIDGGEIPFYEGQGPLVPSQITPIHHGMTRSDEQEYRRIYQSDPREFSGLKKFIGGENQNSSRHGNPNPEVVQAKKYLEWLRMFLISMDSPAALKEIQKKVEVALKACGEEKILPLTNIISTLRTGVHIITKPIESTVPSTSAKDVLLNLHTTLLTLSSPIISAFQHEIKTARVSFGDQDKQFPIDSIRPILETLLLLA